MKQKWSVVLRRRDKTLTAFAFGNYIVEIVKAGRRRSAIRKAVAKWPKFDIGGTENVSKMLLSPHSPKRNRRESWED